MQFGRGATKSLFVIRRAATFGLTLLALAACKSRSPGGADGALDEAGVLETITVPDSGVTESGGVRIAILATPTPVFSASEFPARDPNKATEERKGVYRLGDLRKGAQVLAKPEVLKKTNCPEGWFELLDGGFICGKYATADLSSKELATAPHPPYNDRPLPYDYGLNLTNGTPLYRRFPLRKERADAERGLPVGKTKRDEKGEVVKAESDPAPAGSETPWYLRDHKGARPQVTLDELKGESGLVLQRMVRGFYLGLDQEVTGYAGTFWRTTLGNFVAKNHILMHKSVTEFEGVHLDAADPKRRLPIAFVTNTNTHRHTLEEKNGEWRSHGGELLPRFSIVGVTGNSKVVNNKRFVETIEGWWVRDTDVTIARAPELPPNIGADEKWIDVNLKTQTLVASHGDIPVYATIVSTGRHDDHDPSKDHRTKSGSFRIREKHISATMDDDSASDGPYSIQDVPWIMYFEGSFALHGAFWHSRFGHERSHGCVNMTPYDAREVFRWVGPKLPEGWHGVRATDANPGTRVIVHDEAPPPGTQKDAAKDSATKDAGTKKSAEKKADAATEKKTKEN